MTTAVIRLEAPNFLTAFDKWTYQAVDSDATPGVREHVAQCSSIKRDLCLVHARLSREKGSRRSVSIAPTRKRRDAGPTAVARPVKKAPELGAVIATPE